MKRVVLRAVAPKAVEKDSLIAKLMKEDQQAFIDDPTLAGFVREYVPGEFPVGELFFNEYLDKLRQKCIETNTLTFEEAEPEEYKEAKAAEEAMKSPDFKEIFKYSEDSKYDTNVDVNLIRRAYDNQELWCQQQGEE